MRKIILIGIILILIGGVVMLNKTGPYEFGKPFLLGYHEKAVFEDGLKIHVLEVIHESILGDPDDPDSYGGSGVSVEIKAKKLLLSKKLSLTLLPEQYNPKPVQNWGKYRFTLIDANEKAELKVDKLR